MKILNLALVVTIISSVSSIEECRNVSETSQFHLGSKTPYRIVANKEDTKINLAGCVPQKIWMLTRHGSRNPNSIIIQNMKERLPEIRDLILQNNPQRTDLLRNSDLDSLLTWNNTLEESDDKLLVLEGQDEMVDLSERMQSRFPSLFSPTYSNDTYFFKHTGNERTISSAKFFTTGLFGNRAADDVWYPESIGDDPILRFYKLCTKWQTEVKQNPETLHEMELFRDGPQMAAVIASMNNELNLRDEKLSLDDVFLIYTTCAFETAWHGRRKSPWCSVITPDALKAMEFAEDLKYYYNDGYGYEITYKQACPAFNDMMNYFESTSEFPKAVVYFTHSGTLLKMLAHMGLYKDPQPLTHEDFDKDRKWRSSKIDAFGTNLAFVLHRCDGKQKIVAFHQEKIVQLPNCDSICDFEDFKQIYNESLNCEFDEMCNNIKSPNEI